MTDTDQPLAFFCPVCGGSLDDGAVCERCAPSNSLKVIHRETVLLVVLAVLAAFLYLGTRALANSNRAMQARAAAAWYEAGQRSLSHGRANEAVAAFRKATFDDHMNRAYLLSLAQALQAAGRDDEAQDLLLQLRENAPEEPEINLELARIAARQQDVAESLRYYHNALYGIWSGENVEGQRQAIRRELIEFLISENAKEQALSETVALSAHLPNTLGAHNELGGIFLRVGQPRDALENYRWVLHRDPQNAAALRGAGEAAFRTGDYAQARRWFNAVGRPGAKDKDMLETAKLVLENDPLEPHLSDPDRFQRLRKNMKEVNGRLEQCPGGAAEAKAMQEIQDLKDKLANQEKLLKATRRPHDPNLLFSSLELVYEAESAISRSCGPLNAQDTALLLIGQKSRSVEQ